jgi:hypothetical protein
MDTSILVNVPALIFAASFAQQTILAFNSEPYPRVTGVIRVVLGIGLAAMIEWVF